jgi:hypothetical protein
MSNLELQSALQKFLKKSVKGAAVSAFDKIKRKMGMGALDGDFDSDQYNTDKDYELQMDQAALKTIFGLVVDKKLIVTLGNKEVKCMDFVNCLLRKDNIKDSIAAEKQAEPKLGFFAAAWKSITRHLSYWFGFTMFEPNSAMADLKSKLGANYPSEKIAFVNWDKFQDSVFAAVKNSMGEPSLLDISLYARAIGEMDQVGDSLEAEEQEEHDRELKKAQVVRKAKRNEDTAVFREKYGIFANAMGCSTRSSSQRVNMFGERGGEMVSDSSARGANFGSFTP